MTSETYTHGPIEGACHCGALRFTVTLSDGLNTARRCNCSFCRMRGAVVVSAKLNDLRITAGEEQMRTYQFNTMQAQHHFCGVCGIYTHNRRRSNPQEVAVNVACLAGLSPYDFPSVPVLEGQAHPNDRRRSPAGGPDYIIAGYLSYKDC